MFQKSLPISACFLLFFIYFFAPASIASAETNQLDSISAPSYVLMDADSGQVLKSKNAHQHLAPASMTKVMTMLLALEAIEQGKAHKTDRIIASKKAASIDGTRIYLKPGEVMSLEDLLISMVLASANDASVAVAEKLGGSEAKFVKQMNQKAKIIGMKDSHFKNVTGIPDVGHYSSSYDMAVLARYTIANTSILEYSSLKQYNLRQGEFPIYNGNKLLWRYAGADGLKNGYTSKAKNCLTATAKRGNLRLIAVVMGCPLRGGQTADATTLLNYGFENYGLASLIPAGKVCTAVKVKDGVSKEVPAIVANDVNAIYPKNLGFSFTCRQELPDSIDTPVKKGQKLGELKILYQGKTVKRVDLLAANSVSRLNLIGQIWQIHWGIKLVFITVLALYAIRLFNIHRNQRRQATRSRSARLQQTRGPFLK